jgi:vanillate O-demethylase monooxygenase subunit
LADFATVRSQAIARAAARNQVGFGRAGLACLLLIARRMPPSVLAPANPPVRPPALPHHCTFAASEWRSLARHWYPIAYSDEVADKPLARTLLDQPLILYRTTGRQVVVARDLCLHRGVPLHLGWQEGDELVCAYHGFRYGADGRCTKVPAQPDLPVPKKLCLETYAAVERYGLIWTCLAPAGGATAIPEWPELEDPSYRMMHDAPPEWDVTAGRQMENFIDVGHFSWIHAGTFGNRERTEVPLYEVVPTRHGFHVEYPYLAANPAGAALGAAPTIQRWMVYDLHVPLACRLTIDFGEGRKHLIFDAPTPVSRRRTRIFFFIARNFDHQVPARQLLDWEMKILAEDRPIVESQRPEELPVDLSEEFHIRSDRFATAYRAAMKGLGLGANYSA